MKTLLPMTLLASTAVLADTAPARLPPRCRWPGNPVQATTTTRPPMPIWACG